MVLLIRYLKSAINNKSIQQPYSEVFGIEVEWVIMDDFIKHGPDMSGNKWGLKYDRVFDRSVDAGKILNTTGMKKDDFKSIKEALIYEIEKIKGEF